MNDMKPVNRKISKKNIYIFFLILFVIRLITSLFPSYKIDMNGYVAWSLYLADNGFNGFYRINDVGAFHVVYGPVYPYILWITGLIARLLTLSTLGIEFLIKFWSVLSDLIGAYIIILIGKQFNKEKEAMIAACVYALNPAIIMNSSVWGQFDTMTATLLLYMVYLFNNKKRLLGVCIFTISVIAKPQSAFFGPLVIILYFKYFKFNKKYLKDLLYMIIINICIYILITIPFADGRGVFWLIKLYFVSGGDYPYATANAFNMWTILGGQTVQDSVSYLGLTYALWGVIFIFLFIAVSGLIYVIRRRNLTALYFGPLVLYLGIFMFGPRMHERYMLPALIFIAVCTIWDKRLWIPYILLSLCSFLNVFYIYEKAKIEVFWIANSDFFANIVAYISLFATLLCIYYSYLLIMRKERVLPK